MAEPNPTEWIRRLGRGRPKPQAHLDAVAALEARIGPQMTTRYLEVFFAFVRLNYPRHNAKNFYKEATSPLWRTGVVSGLGAELSRIDGRLALQRELLDKARRGQLAVTSLRARPESEYYTRDPAVPPAFAHYDKAAQWIASGSPNKARDAKKYYAVLHDATVPLPADPASRGVIEGGEVTAAAFGSFGFVRSLHRGVYGFSQPALRSTQPVRYPSTVGGEYLVNQLYATTTIPAQSMLPDHYWTNWAMYFAGAIGAAQPFADGNKRAIHTLYAIVVLQSLGRFIAPKASFESQLFAME